MNRAASKAGQQCSRRAQRWQPERPARTGACKARAGAEEHVWACAMLLTSNSCLTATRRAFSTARAEASAQTYAHERQWKFC